MLVGFPLGMLLAAIPRMLLPEASLNNPLLVVPVGLSLGIGCGLAGILLVILLGQMPGTAVPILSSVWALFYYYSRSQSKVEGWANVAGIFVAWGAYWTWYAT